ncbi:DnaB Replicative DNA helicase [uncultured Caudovirales phage]|uniref:DNA 5'-3' helicase n=1 Tax=uncultured Caudovirales phage TaxID=2100421 RepID=A0A6J5L0D4_9CAUD|nr:DnaB Replicative DNA helicase [uncultured Caudovirales phage]
MENYDQNKEYIDLEKAVLGAIILESYAIDEVSADLKPHCFISPANQHIFQAVLDLREEDTKIDFLTIAQKIKVKGLLDAVGGGAYIYSLLNNVASASNIESHARLVIQGYLGRKVLEICQQGLIKMNDRDLDIFDVYEELKAKFDTTISEVTGNKSFDTIASLGDEFLQETNDRKNGLIPKGLEVGLIDLEQYGGFNKSDLIYGGARPGMGKTSFLIKAATHCAFVQKKPVGIFSIEMKSKQLLTRIAAIDCKINSEDLRKGNVSDSEINLLYARINELKKSRLYIDDHSRELSVIVSQARKMVKKHGVVEIFIDYLGLIKCKGFKDEYSLLTHVSAELKNLAKELDIPIIVFFQLNRDIEKRSIEKRMPLMSDARGSGAIEQDADQMFMLFRPEYYEDCPNENGYYYINDENGGRIDVTGKCFIGYVKNRHGSTGTELVGFRKQYTEFHNLKEPLPELHSTEVNTDFLYQ